MSKVVHLSNDAHALAKVYCKSRGLKMSDWVGSLIIDAISAQEEPKQPEQPQDVSLPRKKQLPRMDESIQSTADGVPVYAQPPFWAKKTPVETEEGTVEAAPESVEPQPLEEAAPAPGLFQSQSRSSKSVKLTNWLLLNKRTNDCRAFSHLRNMPFLPNQATSAALVELVDTTDLKSVGLNRPSRFDSGRRHQA